MNRQRLRRVFDVIGLIAVQPATLSEISRALDIPPSSAHDLLQALLDLDAISSQGRSFVVGPRLIGLSNAVLDSIGVQRVAHHHLAQLATDTNLDVYLAVRSGSELVNISKFSGKQAVNIDIPLGQRLSLHATAVGKLYAAFDQAVYKALVAAPKPALTPRTRTTMEQLEPSLRAIRANRVSVSHGESERGIINIAAPICNADGTLSGVAHLSVLEAAVKPLKVREVLAALQECARDIEVELVEQSRSADR